MESFLDDVAGGPCALVRKRKSAGSGVNSDFADVGRFEDPEADGAGRGGGGLGAIRDACGRVGSPRAPCTVDKVLARCETLTNSAARAAAVDKLSFSLPSPAGEVSRRLAFGLESDRFLLPPKPVPALKRAGAPTILIQIKLPRRLLKIYQVTSLLVLVSDDLCKIPGHPRQLEDL